MESVAAKIVLRGLLTLRCIHNRHVTSYGLTVTKNWLPVIITATRTICISERHAPDWQIKIWETGPAQLTSKVPDQTEHSTYPSANAFVCGSVH